MFPEPPPGQSPIDPRNAFGPTTSASPPPGAAMGTVYSSVTPPGAAGVGSGPAMPPPGMLPPGMFPPGMMPPPFFVPPPPPRRGRARWIVLSVLLFVLLIFSLLINFVLAIGSVSGDGDRERKTTLRSGDAEQIIAVVPIEGEINEHKATAFSRIMDHVDKVDNVRALVLRINTPGGGVAASDEIYERIIRYKKQHEGAIPVVVSMGAMATSGGYYASCAADHIIAEPTTWTANIGVLMPSVNFSDLMKKYGVTDATVVSTGATYKDVGSPFAPVTPEGTAYLQGLADSAFTRFKQIVRTGRGASLKGDIEKIADGRVYSATDAAAAGLVDEIGYQQAAWDYAKKLKSLSDPKVIRYDDNPGLFEILAGQVRTHLTPANTSTGLRINGQAIDLDPEALDQSLRPRLMYLCPLGGK